MVISFSRSFLLIFANEALRVVRGSGPFILRDLRIRAQRPGSDNLSVTALRGPNLLWRDALLDPPEIHNDLPAARFLVIVPVKLSTGAPTTIPSKSSGKRCAEISPCLPPVEHPSK